MAIRDVLFATVVYFYFYRLISYFYINDMFGHALGFQWFIYLQGLDWFLLVYLDLMFAKDLFICRCRNLRYARESLTMTINVLLI